MQKNTKNDLAIIYSFLLIIFTILFAYPSLNYPFGSDQGVFAYMARIILKGGAPYKDAWDIKPPGIYLLYALGMKIFGDSMQSIRIFDLCFTLSSVLLIFYLVKKLFNEHSAFISAFFYIFYYYINDFHVLAQSESFCNLFILITFLFLYLVLTSPRERPNFRIHFFCFLIGIFSVLTVWIKPAAISISLISLYFIIEKWIKEKNTLKLVNGIILFFAGGFGVSILFFIYLLRKDALMDFLYTIFIWDKKYSVILYKAGWTEFIKTMSIPLLYFIKYHLPFLILALIGMIITVIKSRDFGHHFVLGYFLATLLCLLFQGKFFYYHWLTCYIPMSIFIGNLFYLSIKNYKKIYPIIFILVALILIYIYTIEKYLFSFKFIMAYKMGHISEEVYYRGFGGYGSLEPGHFSFQANYEVADYIKNHTNNEDPILIFSFSSVPYYLSKREAPTRFFFNVPVIAPWSNKDWRKEFLNDIKWNPPKYFIFIQGDANPWVSGISKDSYDTMREWKELSNFLTENYIYDTQIELFKLYKLKGNS